MVVSLVLSTQGFLVLHGTFLLRQDHLAAHHCVNRHVPGSHCNGKCFLKKQVERHQEQRDTQPPAVLQVLHAFGFLAPSSAAVVPPRPREAASWAAVVAGSLAAGFPAAVFVPPRAS